MNKFDMVQCIVDVGGRVIIYFANRSDHKLRYSYAIDKYKLQICDIPIQDMVAAEGKVELVADFSWLDDAVRKL